MEQKPRIQRVTPEELPKLLERLRNEKAPYFALIASDINLSENPNDWPDQFKGHVVFQLTEKVSELPAALLQLTQLKTLILWSLGLGDKEVAAISEHLSELSKLDLSINDISDNGVHAICKHLKQLTSLDLGQQIEINSSFWSAQKKGEPSISDTGAIAIAENLSQLSLLDLCYQKIGILGAQSIAKYLGRLTSLNLSLNRVTDAGVNAITNHLKKLTSLNLHANEITDIGAKAISEQLRKLTLLELSRNSISDTGAQAIAEHLGKLTLLSLGSNQISDTGAIAIAKHLVQLTSLNLGNNHISDTGVQAIAKHLAKLIELDIANNPISNNTIAAIGHNLKLSKLNIHKTGVTSLFPLKSMILSGIQLKGHFDWNMDNYIDVSFCPLTHPPVEIVQQGPEAVLNYFREIEEQGKDRLFEAKLLIVGEGGAGKTSLLRRMFMPGMQLPEEDQTTRGIDIYRHEFPVDDGRTFRLNAWDFGGQQIYHATHQFFLTKRSLYVLADDTRTDAKSIHDEGFKFWLEVVETLSEGSPLLIFQNEKGGRSKKIDEPGIKGRFVNVKEFYRGNLEHKGSADDLRKAVEHFAQQLPHIGEDVPAKWVVIREDIEELSKTRPYISQEEYFAVYSKHLEFYREKALHLSQYFHDLGVFLHFQSYPELRRTVFLQNKWVTDAVFRILDDEEVKANRGRFTVSDCDRLWADEGYASKDVELRALMERFELAYRLPDMHEETWLVPQHLSPSKPPELGDWAKTGDLVLTYRYEFLPRGLVSRLMVRMHRFVKQPDLCWSHGALFEHCKTQVLVETGSRGNEISLRSRGPEQKALLSVIASDLDALNDSFRGLKDKVSKLVPCICKTCKGLKEPAMFEQKELIDRKNRGKLTIECPKPPEYYDVSVIELLEGMDIAQWLEKARQELLPEIRSDETRGLSNEFTSNGGAEPKTVRIFLASSSELREDRDAFDLYFRQQNDRLRKEGLYLEIVRWENFLDAMSSTRMQNEYNKAIQNCDLFVSLFKTKTGKYTEEEFDVAHKTFKNTGKPLIYTWFKNASLSTSSINLENLISLRNFQKKLDDLGHYHTEYESIADLQKQFRDQLDKLRDKGLL